MIKPYIDLHLHSTYSLLDGMVKIDDAVKFCKDNNIKALSICDHGSIDSWIKQYNACKKTDIKPILASEFYMSFKEVAENPHNLTKDGKPKKMHTKHYHLNLFAMNEIGYKNIIKLTSYANINNFYKNPRITMDKLKQHSEGIICTTACVGSIFGQLLKRGHVKLAERITEMFIDIFGDRFYIEYGYHSFEDERKVIPHLYNIAQKYNIKTIIGNDTHYLYKSEETAHKILMAKGDKQTLSSKSSFNYSQNYYKNMDEIKETFSEFPYINIDECNNNAYEIVDRCNVEIKFGEYVFPKFATPNGETDDEYLIKLVKQNVKKKYPKLDKEIIARINYELKTITSMKFSGYFLVVQDYINWCKENNITTAPARGSAGGSVVCYIIGIINVDPIKYNLLFERFLNPARVSFPDIDSDIESKKRPLVFEYLKEKYGKCGFSHISTRGMLTAKSCIKMVASKLEYDFGKFNGITAQIGDPAPKTIEEVFEQYPDVKKMADVDEQVKEVFDFVKILQGNIQSIGIHAGGNVICHKDITDYCPIIKTKEGYATGWVDKDIEKIGLIKFDILGLSNLTIIEDCLARIAEPIDLNTIPEDDAKTFDLLCSGKADGIFQFESNSAKSLLKRAKPKCIDDLGVINAANRPGALDSGLTESYIKRKNGLEDVDYIVDGMEEYLSDTNGLPIYQEQILFLFRVMAGFNLAEADLARRAVGKKQIDELMALKDKFVQGSLSNGHTKEKAEEVFDIIDKFANYGFNKSHSIAYSIIGYQCAYLKANYPNEYYCALLNNSIDNDDKKNKYISECFDKGISVLPPNINYSGLEFELDDDKNIVFPLSAIKSVGAGTVTKILNNRDKYGKFKSFIDFIHRCKPDKTTIVSLLETNAFVNIEPKPKRWLDNIEELCEAIVDYKKDTNNKIFYENNIEYGGLIFDKITKRLVKDNGIIEKLKSDKKQIKGASKQAKIDKEDIDKQIEIETIKLRKQTITNFVDNGGVFTKQEIRDNEIKYLSYQLTTNPSMLFNKHKKHFKDVRQGKLTYLFKTLDEIGTDNIGDYIMTVGEIKTVREVVMQKGQNKGKKMAFVSLKHIDKTLEVTIFNSTYEAINIKQGDFLLCYGQVKEAHNKDKSDIDFIMSKCNVLNCIITEEEIVLDITTLDDKKRNMFIKGILTTLQEECYNNNQELNYILKVIDGDKRITAPVYRWIHDDKRFYEMVNRYEVY